MEIQFPDIPLYQGWGRPLRTECNVDGLETVSGAIPSGLNGVWYRAGPDRQYPPMTGDDIFIDGEGMVHMFRFHDGVVDYRSRWVHTERFKLQQQAGRSLFGRYRNRYTNDPSVEGAHMGTANTNAVFHAGRLLVLKEDDLPYEVDPDTLETKGKYDFDGQVKAVSMTAHPKLDPVTDRLLTFSYQASGDATKDVVFYEIDGAGKVVHEVWFEAPYASCVHDFAVTDEHVVFPFFPLITDLEHLKAGGAFYRWHPDEQTVVAVLPRRGRSEDVRFFRGPATSAGHMLNAFTEGDKVHLDLCLYEGNCFPFFTTPQGEVTPAVPPVLTRMTFDLSRNDDSFEKRVITGVPGEMPRTDDRYQGRPYRHGYMVMSRQADGSSGIGHVDVQTGETRIWMPGPNASVQEAQFVPRTPGAPEGEGWLLVLVNRMTENHSELAILDAQDIEAGPVALLRVPVRVRSTFHGTWAPAEALKRGRYAMESAA